MAWACALFMRKPLLDEPHRQYFGSSSAPAFSLRATITRGRFFPIPHLVGHLNEDGFGSPFGDEQLVFGVASTAVLDPFSWHETPQLLANRFYNRMSLHLSSFNQGCPVKVRSPHPQPKKRKLIVVDTLIIIHESIFLINPSDFTN